MDSDIRSRLDLLGYEVASEIYTSGSTHIYRGSTKSDHSCVAIKLLKSLKDVMYEKAYVECTNQISFAYHSRVVQVISSFGIKSQGQELWSFVIVLEWLEKDLHKEVSFRKAHNNPWNEEELLLIARDLIDTLAELQENGLAHRDLKPQNIFYSREGSAKVGDFGSAKTEDLLEYNSYLQQTVVGTPFYMSPELKLALTADLAKAQYNPYKSDVYSLGMTLLFCYQLEPPHSLLDLRILQERTDEVLQAVAFPKLRELLRCMLIIDQETRPDFVQLRKYLNEECQQPRCLHLPAQRHGYEFECHGFFCEVCLPKGEVIPGEGGVLVTVLCPVCSQPYEHYQPVEPVPDHFENCDQPSDFRFLPDQPSSVQAQDIKVQISAKELPSSRHRTMTDETEMLGKPKYEWWKWCAGLCHKSSRKKQPPI